MDEAISRKVKAIQLELAKDVKKVCKNNNIKYFLDSGTLLGAVRHSGFIPWDDDLDLGMLRSDYERFLHLAAAELADENELVEWKTEENYPHQFCKIMRKNTVYKEEAQGGNAKCGVYIDIFPYDVYPDDRMSQFFQRIQIMVLRGMIRAKCKHKTWRTNGIFYFGRWLKNLPFRVLSLFCSKENLIEKYEKCAEKYNGKKHDFYFPQGVEGYGEWLIPSECLDNLKLIRFEEEEFSCPIDTDAYLCHAYGDYMTLPPESEREGRHSVVEIKL